MRLRNLNLCIPPTEAAISSVDATFGWVPPPDTQSSAPAEVLSMQPTEVPPEPSAYAEEFPRLPEPAEPPSPMKPPADLASTDLIAALDECGPQLRAGALSIRK